MPLLHQDTSRGGGGSNENRRSLADFLGLDTNHLGLDTNHLGLDTNHLGLDTNHLGEPAPATANHRGNEGGQGCDGEWRWEEPGSPEVAHTPRALVPPACFPPRHPRAFASFSESARPGNWPEEYSGQGITDLVASLKALAMPATSARPAQTQLQVRLSFAEQPPPDDAARPLTRRASFCGTGGGGGDVPGPGPGPQPQGGMGGGGGSGGGGVERWSGTLPARCVDPSGGFSPKVFLGGLPYDITESALLHSLRQFQPVRVEWPGRECGAAEGGGGPRGFAYVTFESERRVHALLAASRRDGPDWYYRVTSRRMRSKEAQVIPWAVADSSWVRGGSARLAPARTVFVGALHGMLSASALALIMDDLFSGVVYAGIDTDKHKYPIGSGRVTFSNVRSYVRAISAGHVHIVTDKFSKKVQVDPYLEDSMCSVCNVQQGPYFCREPMCFRYLCRSCWVCTHARGPPAAHRPLMRSSRAPRRPDHYYALPNDGGTPSPPNSGSGASGSGTSGTNGEFEPAADDPPDWA